MQKTVQYIFNILPNNKIHLGIQFNGVLTLSDFADWVNPIPTTFYINFGDMNEYRVIDYVRNRKSIEITHKITDFMRSIHVKNVQFLSRI